MGFPKSEAADHPRDADGDPQEFERLGGRLGSQNKTFAFDVQVRHAICIACRVAIPPDVAILLATLILGEAGT